MEQAVLRVADDYPDGDDADVLYPASRAWVARGFLAQGTVLGNPAAADADRPRSQPGPNADLAPRVEAVSPLRRAVLVLRYRELMPAPVVAQTVGSKPDGILLYLDHLLDGLGVRRRRRSVDAAPAAYREEDLENLLDRHGADVRTDVSAVRRTLSITLGFVEADIPVPSTRQPEADAPVPEASASTTQSEADEPEATEPEADKPKFPADTPEVSEAEETEDEAPTSVELAESPVADAEPPTPDSSVNGFVDTVVDLDFDDLPDVAVAETIAQESTPGAVDTQPDHAARVRAALALVDQLRAARASAERLEAERAAAQRRSGLTGVPAAVSGVGWLDRTATHVAIRTPSSLARALSGRPEARGRAVSAWH